ncbi:tyrosine-type recombinase/integrase [Amnibacterium kyonggiense]|uniref:tyrosine-type recombinase/integrase n=1 Tax=Amnibacterium kyonggiense TaxID=595671 RepID=UPI0013C31631|nr:tyrosine-type recombinase/integrase [Amnibacterium kyonggiense]
MPGHRTLSYDYAFAPKGFYRYQFRPAAAPAGLGDLKLHELRHAAATMWVENGISTRDVSPLLGHASYAIADRVYAHVRKRDWSAERRRISAAGARHPVTPVALRS